MDFPFPAIPSLLPKQEKQPKKSQAPLAKPSPDAQTEEAQRIRATKVRASLIEKPKKARLWKNVALAIGMHGVLTGTPKAAEQIEEPVTRAWNAVERATSRVERRSVRTLAIDRARKELREGRLNFWAFLRDTDQADLQEQGETVMRELAEERYYDASRIFRERLGRLREVRNMEDARHAAEALAAALGDYDYVAGFGGADVLTFFQEKGGPCRMNTLGTLAVMAASPLWRQLGMRAYPPNADGIGHWAPILRFTLPDGTTEEIDLVAQRPALQSGIFQSLEDIVRRYAENQTITPNHDPMEHVRNTLGRMARRTTEEQHSQSSHTEESRRATGAQQRARTHQPSTTGGWDLALPAFRPGDHASPGNIPFVRRLTAEHFSTERVQPESPTDATDTRQIQERQQEVLSATRSLNDLLPFYPTSHSITDPEQPSETEIPLETTPRLSPQNWNDLSHAIRIFEREINQTQSPAEKAVIAGSLVMLYRIGSSQAALSSRGQAYRMAESKIAHYRAEGTTLLQQPGVIERVQGERVYDIAFLGPIGEAKALQLATTLMQDLRSLRGEGDYDLVSALRLLINLSETRERAMHILEQYNTPNRIIIEWDLSTENDIFNGSDRVSHEVRATNRIRTAFGAFWDASNQESESLRLLRDAETIVREAGVAAQLDSNDPETQRWLVAMNEFANLWIIRASLNNNVLGQAAFSPQFWQRAEAIVSSHQNASQFSLAWEKLHNDWNWPLLTGRSPRH